MLVLTADQMVRLTVSFTDRYGNPATIDGTPRWETSDDGIVTVAAGDDGASADVVTTGRIGTAQVRVIADAAGGENERLIIGLQEIQVVGGEALIVQMTAGAASPKPEAPADTDTPTPTPE